MYNGSWYSWQYFLLDGRGLSWLIKNLTGCRRRSDRQASLLIKVETQSFIDKRVGEFVRLRYRD